MTILIESSCLTVLLELFCYMLYLHWISADFKEVLFRFQTESLRLELLFQFLYFLDPAFKHLTTGPSKKGYSPTPTYPQYCTNHPLEKQEALEADDLQTLFSFLRDMETEDNETNNNNKGNNIELSKDKKEFIRYVSFSLIFLYPIPFYRRVFSIGLSAFPGNISLISSQLAFESAYHFFLYLYPLHSLIFCYIFIWRGQEDR